MAADEPGPGGGGRRRNEKMVSKWKNRRGETLKRQRVKPGHSAGHKETGGSNIENDTLGNPARARSVSYGA